MRKMIAFGISMMILVPCMAWIALYIKGRQFALRDHLRKADAIVVLAGTRGNIKFLHGKISTAVRLYQQGWAPVLIMSGRFSAKVTEKFAPIPLCELQEAAAQGRIQASDVDRAAKLWDTSLGAGYMADQARQMDVPPEAIIVEDESLHTRENAEHVLALLKEHQARRIILVTSPFHQLRTYLTFVKVLQPRGIEIMNYYANTREWHPASWFLSAEHRRLVKLETERIHTFRAKGDLL
jgi:uncharacterized SAM-binding protein YcdF (DUF218 family)